MKHELECWDCTILDAWRKHNAKCRTCGDGTDQCKTGRELEEKYWSAREPGDGAAPQEATEAVQS